MADIRTLGPHQQYFTAKTQQAHVDLTKPHPPYANTQQQLFRPRMMLLFVMRQATLAKLRAQSSAAMRDWSARNGKLAAEKDAVVREHVMLKAGLGSFRATQALRLKQLSVCRCARQKQHRGQLWTHAVNLHIAGVSLPLNQQEAWKRPGPSTHRPCIPA